MKNYDHILFCGDSWTMATHTDNIWPRPYLLEETFPYIVAKKLNTTYTKIARGGVGNDWIHRNVYNYLPKLTEKYKKILCIVGWSDPHRKELYSHSTNQLEPINDVYFSSDFYKNYMVESFAPGHDIYSDQNIILIKSLRCLYKCLNIDYVDAFSMTPPLHVNFLGSAMTLDKNYVEITGTGEGRLYDPKTGIYWHQTPIGNQMIADELVKFVQKNYG